MSEPPFQRNNAPREPMDAPEEKALEAFLREHDPAEPVGEGFSPRQRSRVVRYMEHPILATIYLHHRTAALTGAVLVVALTILLLIWWKMVRPVEPLLRCRAEAARADTGAGARAGTSAARHFLRHVPAPLGRYAPIAARAVG